MKYNLRRKHLFIKNTAILTVTSLLLRAAGMYFSIYITGIIGAEGIGLYHMIFSIYLLMSGFASSGIVVAVTRMTADEMALGSRKSTASVLQKCLAVSIAMGLISAAATAGFAEVIGLHWISDQRSVSAVKAMALAFPFMSISCCLRGYFTARRRVGISSFGQMTEQAVRIVVCLVLLIHMAPMGVAYSCLAIMIADAVSEGAGCLFLAVGYLFDRKKCPNENPLRISPPYREYRQIWDIAGPITASHYLTTLLRTIESILVPDCLTRFVLSRSRALELFGLLRGMAMPLIFFPSTFLTALTALLVPELSEAQATGNVLRTREVVRRSMKITFALSMPAAGVFLLMSDQLGMLVYNRADVGPLLRALAPMMPLMYAESVVAGILRGLGEQKKALQYNIIDSVARILLIVAMVPFFGMTGFLLMMVFSNLLTSLLKIHRLLKVTEVKFCWSSWLFRPTASICIACLAGFLLSRASFFCGLSSLWQMVIGSVSVMLLYCAALIFGEDERDPRKLFV